MSNGYPEQVRAYLPHPWQLFKDTWRFYCLNFRTVSQIVCWPALVWLLALWFEPRLNLAPLLLGLLVALWAQAALVSLLVGECGSERLAYCVAYRSALTFLVPLVWLTLLLLLILSGGLVILAIPALVGLVYLMFGPFILVDQKHHGLAALTASWAYVATYWWSVFGRLLFLLVPAALVTLLIRLGGWPIGLIFFWFLFWPVGLIYLFQIYAWLKRLKPDVEVAIANGPKKQD